jgi:PEP-CTERM motif
VHDLFQEGRPIRVDGNNSKMKTRTRYPLGIAILAVTLLAPLQANAWTVTATGTIDSSTGDALGLFGDGSTSLKGDAYSETITTDPNLNSTALCATATCLATEGTAPYTLTVEVNGISFVHTDLAPADNLAILENGLSAQDPANPFDVVNQSVFSGNCATSLTDLCVTGLIQAFSSTTPFVPQLNFNQNITVAGGSNLDQQGNSFTSFVVSDALGDNTNFVGSIDSLSVQPVGVPEPGTIALLGVGLVGIALAQRRRRALAAATV